MISRHTIEDPNSGASQAPEGPQTVHRALEILTCVVNIGPLALSDIALAVNLPASTTMRMLRALEHWGYVVRLDDGRYSIGEKFVQSRVEPALPRAEELIELSGDILAQLTQDTLESSYLAVRGPAQGTCTFLREEQSPLPIRFVGFDGWAGRTVAVKNSVAGEIFKNGTPESGYTVMAAVTDPDSTTVGAPVTVEDGTTVAVLSVAGPSFRMPLDSIESYGQAVKAAAQKLAMLLDASAVTRT